MTTEQWLLILLSGVVIFFLIVAIIFIVVLIKLTRRAKRVADKAGDIAENLAGASKVVKRTVLEPTLITSAVYKAVKSLMKRRKK